MSDGARSAADAHSIAAALHCAPMSPEPTPWSSAPSDANWMPQNPTPMSVAGIGVGFCGIQFASDGALLHGVGSGDMGAQCNAAAMLCASAADLAPSDMCGSAGY